MEGTKTLPLKRGPKPGPVATPISTIIAPALYDQLRDYCRRTGRTIRDVVEAGIGREIAYDSTNLTVQ